MRKLAFCLSAVFVFLASPPAMAGGLSAGADLEHARANARAGGPLSEVDKDLLEQWGCLSGTQHPFCKQLEARDRAPKKPRNGAQKHKRH